MLRVNSAVTYMDKLLIKKDKEIERTNKILADHNERIRVLEIAVQYALDNLKATAPSDVFNKLQVAIAQSHKIALKEYP
jgi:hypothetical protein